MATKTDEDKKAEPPKPPPYFPSNKPNGDYPLIDNDPHFLRVCRYMRTSDYVQGAALAASCPAVLLWWERVSPTYVGPGVLPSMLRLTCAIGVTGGFLLAYQNSCMRFYGGFENSREVAMDMREMTDKVKRGEPLYGTTELNDYMQGVAARNSRYSAMMFHIMPMFNFVNHNHHGVDTAKYYQQAERELEAERLGQKYPWPEPGEKSEES